MKLVRTKRNSQRAQTIIELFAVLMSATFFFAASFLLFTIFDISQKQSMLVRTQAFIELGNYSEFGRGRHGTDNVKNAQSRVTFTLGEDQAGAQVDLNSVQDFKNAVAGEMTLEGARVRDPNAFWNTYRFPKARVSFGGSIDFAGVDLGGTLTQRASIASNRSFTSSSNLASGLIANSETGMYSGSAKFLDWYGVADKDLSFTGRGLQDNTAALDEALKRIVQDDPSLYQEAEDFRGTVKASDGLFGGAIAALISAGISAAMYFGMQAAMAAIKSAAEASGSAASAAGSTSNGLNDLIKAIGPDGTGLLSGDNFFVGAHNFAQVAGTLSNGMTLVNLGASLGGKPIQGLQTASSITGAAGAIAGGVSSFGQFQGVTVDGKQVLGEAGLNSTWLGGTAQIAGGLGTFAGFASPEAGMAFGIASAGFGAAGSVTGVSEGLSGASTQWGSRGENGFVWKDEASQWAAVGAIGGAVSAVGGFVSVAAPKSGAGQVLGLAGSGISAVGAAGSFGNMVKTGEITAKKPFEAMAITGSTVGAISGFGAQASVFLGNKELGEAFTWGALGGAGISMVGTLGLTGQAIADGIKNSSAKKPDSGKETTIEGDVNTQGPKVAKVDTRTGFEKFNDAYKATNKSIAVASGVLGSAAGVKGAVESVAAAKEARDLAYSHAAEMRAQAAKENRIAEAQIAGGSVEASSVGSQSAKASAQYASAQTNYVNASLNLMNAEGVRFALSDAKAARFDSYKEEILRIESRINDAQNRGKEPELSDVEALEEMHKRLEALVASERDNLRASQAVPGGNLSLLTFKGSTSTAFDRLEGFDQLVESDRLIQSSVAQLIRSQGYDGFRKSSAAMVSQAPEDRPSAFQQTRKSLRALDGELSKGPFTRDEKSVLHEKIAVMELALIRMREKLERGEFLPPDELRRIQENVQVASRIISKYSKVKIYTYEENRKTIEGAARSYEELKHHDGDVQAITVQAEEQVSSRLILAKDRETRSELRKLGEDNARKIRAHRLKYYADSRSELGLRMKDAEHAWRNIQFVTPREALDTLKERAAKRQKNYSALRVAIVELYQRNERPLPPGLLHDAVD